MPLLPLSSAARREQPACMHRTLSRRDALSLKQGMQSATWLTRSRPIHNPSTCLLRALPRRTAPAISWMDQIFVSLQLCWMVVPTRHVPDICLPSAVTVPVKTALKAVLNQNGNWNMIWLSMTDPDPADARPA